MVIKPTKEPALYHFYKIVCKDTTVKDFYIGSTISWARRKCMHNTNTKTNNALVYKKIRAHGGFNNWLMLEIERGMYIKSDALLREYELMQTLGSTLNIQTAINGICKHNKPKARCRECGGSAYCKHNKQKARCRECGGSSICKHNKEKDKCRECGGSAYCKHDKQKRYCRECDGSAYCKHNKHKAYCRECGGSAYCKHDKPKAYCRECGGSSLCKHDKQKRYCRECGGSAYCKHDKQKALCRECGGSAYCKHDKQKYNCHVCKETKLLLLKIEETKKKTEEIKRRIYDIMNNINKASNQCINHGGRK